MFNVYTSYCNGQVIYALKTRFTSDDTENNITNSDVT
jgi:hypothetical protein